MGEGQSKERAILGWKLSGSLMSSSRVATRVSWSPLSGLKGKESDMTEHACTGT